MNPILNYAVGGWQLGGIVTLRSGLPVTIQGTDVSGTTGLGPRASAVPGQDWHGTQGVGPNGTWFNTAAFRNPTAATFGDLGVGTARGPGLTRFDLSLQKEIAVNERARFEIRADAYGLTNTPTFNAPDRLVTSATFGQILTSQGERNMQLALKLYF